jgi:glucan 1,3-beta-glucosidase
MYQYRLVGADNHYMALIQTETVRAFCFNPISFCADYHQPYFQPSPPAPEPFKFDSRFGDPQFPLSLNVKSSWALSVESSKRILIFGKQKEEGSIGCLLKR